jgi:hypothetical protein
MTLWLAIFGVITFGLSSDIILSIIVVVTVFFIVTIFRDTEKRVPFFEFVAILYLLNYWISPYITYQLTQDLVKYPMKLEQSVYFDLMVPGFIFFLIGLFLLGIQRQFKFPIFTKSLPLSLSAGLLITILILGVFMGRVREIFGLGYLFYLMEQLGHVSAMLLISEHRRRFKFWKILPLFVKFIVSFYTGFYHDLLIWMILYGFWLSLIYRWSLTFKLQLTVIMVIFIFFIQAIKFDFREASLDNESDKFDNVLAVSNSAINEDKLFSEENFLATLNRANQSWILASTVDNMERTKDFQGVGHFIQYFEAALLPRFLLPNKLVSGDKVIFNKFSGHQINGSTSMGLGVFADGYIAGGRGGVFVAAFLFGLLISLFSKLIVSWMDISPYYLVLLFPIFSYAVRPDCEFQTALNHIVKSTLFLYIFVQITKYRFVI